MNINRVNNENEVRVISLIQAKAYIKNGVQPLRIEADEVMIFVFDKNETKDLFEQWKNRTIKF
ncbi:MAG: hypothetical protein E7E64_12980 [Clostridium celatum]|nr:hypothetical protein [Clostridium celatum]MDU4979839.1 hypothetical protein [Clostridium celatum]